MTLLSYVYPTNNHTNGKTQIIILISPQKKSLKYEILTGIFVTLLLMIGE